MRTLIVCPACGTNLRIMGRCEKGDRLRPGFCLKPRPAVWLGPDLRWEQIDLEHALLHVRKLKNGSPATHPLTGKELRALRRLQRKQDTKSPFVFSGIVRPAKSYEIY